MGLFLGGQLKEQRAERFLIAINCYINSLQIVNILSSLGRRFISPSDPPLKTLLPGGLFFDCRGPKA